MTTIIGVEYKDHCVIMADSRVTDDDGRVFSHPVMRKIANLGDVIIAGSGEVAPCDVAQNLWVPPTVTAKDKKDPYRYMITKAMPSLRKCLVENGYNFDEPKDKGDTQSRFQFLIAVGGELFDVDEDLAVMKSDKGFYAIGSGGAYALGALYANAEPGEAMKIASEISAFTSPPFAFDSQEK